MLKEMLKELNLEFALNPIGEHIPKHALATFLNELNKRFAGKTVRHKGGNLYWIYGFEIGNRDGNGYYDVKYYSVDSIVNNQPFIDRELPFNRPCSEFFDGRFTLYK